MLIFSPEICERLLAGLAACSNDDVPAHLFAHTVFLLSAVRVVCSHPPTVRIKEATVRPAVTLGQWWCFLQVKPTDPLLTQEATVRPAAVTLGQWWCFLQVRPTKPITDTRGFVNWKLNQQNILIQNPCFQVLILISCCWRQAGLVAQSIVWKGQFLQFVWNLKLFQSVQGCTLVLDIYGLRCIIIIKAEGEQDCVYCHFKHPCVQLKFLYRGLTSQVALGPVDQVVSICVCVHLSVCAPGKLYECFSHWKIVWMFQSLCIVMFRVQELCESRDGCPGLPALLSLTVSVDVKQHWTMLTHWSVCP